MVFESLVNAADALLNIKLLDLAVLAGIGAVIYFVKFAFDKVASSGKKK